MGLPNNFKAFADFVKQNYDEFAYYINKNKNNHYNWKGELTETFFDMAEVSFESFLLCFYPV